MSGLLTLRRLVNRKRTTAPQSTQVARLDLARLERGLRDYYTEAEAFRFLFAPHALLGGRSAIELIAAGRVTDVNRIIALLDDGAFL